VAVTDLSEVLVQGNRAEDHQDLHRERRKPATATRPRRIRAPVNPDAVNPDVENRAEKNSPQVNSVGVHAIAVPRTQVTNGPIAARTAAIVRFLDRRKLAKTSAQAMSLAVASMQNPGPRTVREICRDQCPRTKL
jgi:hypothetical protein